MGVNTILNALSIVNGNQRQQSPGPIEGGRPERGDRSHSHGWDKSRGHKSHRKGKKDC